MPMHDWTRVKSGIYHNFHYRWIAAIMDRLNAGLLPEGYFAMAEQIIGTPETDVVALNSGPRRNGTSSDTGTATAPKPKTRFVSRLPREQERYARKANVVTIRHELGAVVSVIELVSPGNKDRRNALQTFVDKALDIMRQGVNLLIVDPFPPTQHDPHGIHGAIWNELSNEPFELPCDKQLTLASYHVAYDKTAYVETFAVGEALPDMALFLEGDNYVNVPLEETYQTTWNVLPVEVRGLLESVEQP